MKKIIIIILVTLAILFPFLKEQYSKIVTPDKIVYIGNQVSDNRIDFNKKIIDTEKIKRIEKIYKNINFIKTEEKQLNAQEKNKIEKYPDIVLRLFKPKEGIDLINKKIWFLQDKGILMDTFNYGYLSIEQMSELKDIIDFND